MEELQCKDFFIIKLRYYADDKVLKKHYATLGHENLPLPKQQWERAEMITKFFSAFTEKVTGRSYNSWIGEYMFSTRECIQDEILETHGIFISDGEGWYTYFIPLKHVEIIEWVKNNTVMPTKIMTRVNLWPVRHYQHWLSKERRDDSRTHTIKFLKEHNLTPQFFENEN